MTAAAFDELDLLLVASAGSWSSIPDATEEERALAGSCALLEADLRQREWAAFETVLPYIVDGRVEPPDEGPQRIAVLAAVVALGWHYPAAATGREP